MDFIMGIDRNQLSVGCLEEMIGEENAVRVVDAFVDHIEISKLGFIVNTVKSEGRPAYDSNCFLKIYLYGYLNGIRSSRRLEKECIRNIELQWLTGSLRPNYHSISDFRKVNPKALKNTFKLFGLFLKDADLIAGETIAIDGTKVRAHNSKKNNYSQKKIDRHLLYVEERVQEYLTQLDSNDVQEDSEKVRFVEEKLALLKNNKIKYELLQEKLDASNESQVSTTDADSRALLVQGQVVEVSYNVQAAVDSKYKLIVATHTINRNDRNAMSAIALEAKQNLHVESLTVILDKGYHNGRELQICKDNNITTIVAHQETLNDPETGTSPDYLLKHFFYNKEEDYYTCPQGKRLQTNGTWYVKKREEKISYRFKKYRTGACKECPVKNLCTGRVKGGRELERSEYAEAVEQNNVRYKENAALYRTRQEINEHIFGTIKRKWGYNHTNLMGLEKVNGEMSLIMLVYNLKRSMNILGITELITKIKKWKPDYTGFSWLSTFLTSLKHLWLQQIFALSFIYTKSDILKKAQTG